MAKLPPSAWQTLGAARKYVAEETGMHTWGVVEDALSGAFRDEIVKTRGRCQRYFEHGMQVPLSGVVWSGADIIVWSEGLFSSEIDDGPLAGWKDVLDKVLGYDFTFEDVEVERESLERWLSVGAELEPTPAIDTPGEGEQDKLLPKKARKAGEPKPQTIAGWKEAHDEIKRFQQLHGGPAKFKLTEAAKEAALDLDRSADKLMRDRRRYIAHQKAAKRHD